MIAPEPTISLKTTILQITVFWNRIPPKKIGNCNISGCQIHTVLYVMMHMGNKKSKYI